MVKKFRHGRSGRSDKNLRLKIQQVIARDLRQRIESGNLPPGAQIPTEDQLKAEHNVSRTAVRAAINELANGGLIDVRPPKGTFVVDRRPTETVPLYRGDRFALRMPDPDEMDELGTLRRGEPVIDIQRLDGTDITLRTLGKIFEVTIEGKLHG